MLSLLVEVGMLVLTINSVGVPPDYLLAMINGDQSVTTEAKCSAPQSELDQSGQADSEAKQSPPQRLEELEPELQTILKQWVQHNQKVETLQIHFRRWIYRSTFEVESRSQGYFWLEKNGDWGLVAEPRKISQSDVSSRTGVNGKPWRLMSNERSILLKEGTTFWAINEQNQKVDFTEGFGFLDKLFGRKPSPLDPGLFIRPFRLFHPESKIKDLLAKYHVTWKRGETKVILDRKKGQRLINLDPRSTDSNGQKKRLRLIWDAERNWPIAIQESCQAERQEVVYTFLILKINEPIRDPKHRIKLKHYRNLLKTLDKSSPEK